MLMNDSRKFLDNLSKSYAMGREYRIMGKQWALAKLAENRKPANPLVDWICGNRILVTRTGIEMNFCNFTTYHSFEKTPILRGLQALNILRYIKIYHKFS